MNNFDTSGFVERGHSLFADMHTFAEQLSTSSRDAIQSVNPELTDTALGEAWPLTFNLGVEQRLISMIGPAPRLVGGVALTESAVTKRPTAFTLSKFDNDILGEAYGDERPRHAFAADIVGWAQRMEECGWPLLAVMGILDRRRVELSIYEDNTETNAYLGTLISGQPPAAGDANPYVRLSDRVAVDSPGFAVEVLSK